MFVAAIENAYEIRKMHLYGKQPFTLLKGEYPFKIIFVSN